MKKSWEAVNAVGDLIRKSVGFQVFQFDCFLFCFLSSLFETGFLCVALEPVLELTL